MIGFYKPFLITRISIFQINIFFLFQFSSNKFFKELSFKQLCSNKFLSLLLIFFHFSCVSFHVEFQTSKTITKLHFYIFSFNFHNFGISHLTIFHKYTLNIFKNIFCKQHQKFHIKKS